MPDAISATVASMQNDIQRMNVIANHAANAITPGFKRSFISVVGGYENLGTQDSEVGVPSQTLVTDFRPGVPRKTGLPLDIALTSEGFLEVRTDTGVAYTRTGALHLDSQGKVVTTAGFPVAGVSGDLTLSTTSPTIGQDGRIFEKGNQVGQFKIVAFDNPDQLQPMGGGLFIPNGNVTARDVAQPQLLQGHLESSNVDSAREMTSLIETYRHFESGQRMLQAYDDLRDKTFRALGQF